MSLLSQILFKFIYDVEFNKNGKLTQQNADMHISLPFNVTERFLSALFSKTETESVLVALSPRLL